MRVLAVSSDERVEGVDAPTLKEAGIDLTFTNWRGVLAPPGISDDAKQAMVKVLEEMHGTQQWKEALVKNGWTDAFMTGAAVRAVPEGPGQPGLVDADRTGAAMTHHRRAAGQRGRSKTRRQGAVPGLRGAGRGRRVPDLRRADPGRRVSRRWIPVGRRCLPDRHRRRPDRAGDHPGDRDSARIDRRGRCGRGHRPERAGRLAHRRPARRLVRRDDPAGRSARLGDHRGRCCSPGRQRFWAASTTSATS